MSFASVSAITEWTVPFATAARTTARHVFATATFAFSVISSPTDAREKMTALVIVMEMSVATSARAAAGANVTTV